jgi:uncharacterized membrane protein YoaK (UPF0700 family)
MITKIKSFCEERKYIILGIVILCGHKIIIDAIIPLDKNPILNFAIAILCFIGALKVISLGLRRGLKKEKDINTFVRRRFILRILIIISACVGVTIGILINLNPHWLK